MRHRLLLLVVGFIFLLGMGTAYALTEHIANGTFDGDVNHWIKSWSNGGIVYDGTEGYTSTGAAKVTNSSANVFSAGGRQCVTVTPNGIYTAKAWAKVPSGQSAANGAFIRIHFYTSADCSGTAVTYRDSGTTTTTDTWEQVTEITTAPDNANSAYVNIYVRKTSGNDPVIAYFDDVTFYDSNSNAVTLSTFSASSTRLPGAATQSLLLASGFFAISGAIFLHRKRF